MKKIMSAAVPCRLMPGTHWQLGCRFSAHLLTSLNDLPSSRQVLLLPLNNLQMVSRNLWTFIDCVAAPALESMAASR